MALSQAEKGKNDTRQVIRDKSEGKAACVEATSVLLMVGGQQAVVGPSSSFSRCYLSESCFLAQIPDRQEYKSLKHKHLALTQSHKATESGRHFRVRLLRVLVPLCEYVFWLRPEAALGVSRISRLRGGWSLAKTQRSPSEAHASPLSLRSWRAWREMTLVPADGRGVSSVPSVVKDLPGDFISLCKTRGYAPHAVTFFF